MARGLDICERPGAEAGDRFPLSIAFLLPVCAPYVMTLNNKPWHDNFMNDAPIYVSNCTKRSLWQKYEIYLDRVELHTWVGTFKIRMDQIQDVEVYPPALKSLRLHLRKCLPVGIKLDTSDFSEHVILDKKKGFARHVLFTPEDPAEFKRVLAKTLADFQKQPPLP